MTRFRHTMTSAAMATALLATLSLPGFAQTTSTDNAGTAATQAAPQKQWRGERHGGDFREHMKQRAEKLKADLKLTSAQQAAWDSYMATMKPAGERPARMDRQEFAKLTTPQRLDKMREMRTQRNAEMDRRADATKAFYAQLNADQQKTFDAQSMRMMHRPEHGPREGKRHHGGKPGQERPAAPAPAQ